MGLLCPHLQSGITVAAGLCLEGLEVAPKTVKIGFILNRGDREVQVGPMWGSKGCVLVGVQVPIAR